LGLGFAAGCDKHGFLGTTLTAIVLIPARFGSTRFPAKIVASATGMPLVQHVVDRLKNCKRVKKVMVATDDQRIVDALAPFGTHTVMTSPAHQSGTDRIAEVAQTLPDEVDIVVNVQGDEPEIDPDVVDRLIERMQSSDHDMATAATAFPKDADPNDPNLVKVVMDQSGRAIYFSRCPIPYRRDSTQVDPPPYYLHIGLYAYRRSFLLQFASWPPSRLETTEKLEQLRALEQGRSIYVLTVERATHGIDTAEQYAEFVRRHSNRR
jgi:3-deoxy-manno-octulosonate cytidylyltransferase (CMP-KDO synthetase)